uniref:Ribosome recycling factor domain-containing protein n=1 Tax=Proboscia inermis TaxID=420281 RepID=A0A7S0C8E8_9STRA|mmetsp:Transcript_32181/g.32455  ORF Transcript_32181/g.32455 Transcript_32181/m.32455 type:complete len:163 (+) Transcript_32181:2-490(+)
MRQHTIHLASIWLFSKLMEQHRATPTPLNQVAGISVTSSQQLTLTPYDKTAMEDIERGIIDSGLGLTPNNDGNVIRINIPDLTEERRKEFMKQCKALGEDGKVAIRNVRRDGVDAVKKMEKAGSIGKDEMLDGLDEMQKITDTYVKSADDAVQKKESELMKL